MHDPARAKLPRIVRLPHDPPRVPTKCGARTRAGTPCGRWAVWPQGKCNLHGGKSRPRGIGHHCYRHGRRSKCFLARLLAAEEMGLRTGLAIPQHYLDAMIQAGAPAECGSAK
jgi:hypothetical protein